MGAEVVVWWSDVAGNVEAEGVAGGRRQEEGGLVVTGGRREGAGGGGYGGGCSISCRFVYFVMHLDIYFVMHLYSYIFA
jgi:hypothetical protein